MGQRIDPSEHDEDMVHQMSVISIRLHGRGFHAACQMVLEARDLVLDRLDAVAFKSARREP